MRVGIPLSHSRKALREPLFRGPCAPIPPLVRSSTTRSEQVFCSPLLLRAYANRADPFSGTSNSKAPQQQHAAPSSHQKSIGSILDHHRLAYLQHICISAACISLYLHPQLSWSRRMQTQSRHNEQRLPRLFQHVLVRTISGTRRHPHSR